MSILKLVVFLMTLRGHIAGDMLYYDDRTDRPSLKIRLEEEGTYIFVPKEQTETEDLL